MVRISPADKRKLNKDQASLKGRIRRHDAALQRDINQYLKKEYEKPVEEWDIEELAHGRPRNQEGKFNGPRPSWLTEVVVSESRRRLVVHTFGTLTGYVDKAIKVLVDTLENDDTDVNGKFVVDHKTKVQVATFIVEHVIGKPRNTIELHSQDSARQFLASALVLDDGLPAHPVVDGQFVINDDEEDEDE